MDIYKYVNTRTSPAWACVVALASSPEPSDATSEHVVARTR